MMQITSPPQAPAWLKLALKIDHHPVNGLQLSDSLVLDSVMDGAPTHMELAFSDYAVKSH